MTTVKKNRIESIDLLRGIIMIIMALDHSRDYFHHAALTEDPLNLATTNLFLYFTRWITHFCAPIFLFLSGTSAWLQSGRKTTKELSQFLITRGLWLILVDLFIITLGTTGDIYFSYFIIQTLWAIGISMAILGLMIWLPFYVILATGLVIVLGHNTLDFAEADHQGSFPFWWQLLHKPADIVLGNGQHLFIFYPFLSWSGLMMLGYCFGKVFTTYQPPQRNKILIATGLGLLAFYAVLRFTNLYGDPVQWSAQKNSLYTFLSFMNVQKYPPSLLYMCATIGPALIFLGLVNKTGSRLAKIFIIYGRVPMFYYIIHFYILSSINIILYLSRGHTVADGLNGAAGMPWKFVAPGEGYSLAVAYAIWIAVVITLYPLCKWYDRYKSSHPEKTWLSYL